MDIEMVQKINKLAVDLLDQGITSSRIEAVKKAEEMLSRDGSREISDMQEAEPMQKVVVEETKEPVTTIQQATVKQDPVIEQLKTAMLKNNDYFVKTFKELQSMISSLKNEIGSLKNEISEVKRSAAQQAAKPAQPTLNQIHEKVEIAKPVEEIKAQPHPRQGSYNPEDVSVEKIFYMGKK